MTGQIVKFESSYIEPYPTQVKGESFHKENIESVLGFVDEDDGAQEDAILAHLVLDDQNKYDPLAVRVEIEGKTVGHLSKEDARRYRTALAALKLANITGECYASIRGGFLKKSTGEQADFGVRLDIDLTDLAIEKPRSAVPPPPAKSPVYDPVGYHQSTIAPHKPAKKKFNLSARMVVFILLSLLVLCVFIATLSQQ